LKNIPPPSSNKRIIIFVLSGDEEMEKGMGKVF
jgi:hypothetical protein